MTLLEQIEKQLSALPPEKQSEVLDFIAFLQQRANAALQPALIVAETALLSEAALAEDWMRPEEDEAWSYLNQATS